MDITRFLVPVPAGRGQDLSPEAVRSGGCPCKSSPSKTRTYYGNAEPEGKTVMVGGAEVVVGGWVAYEANRRSARAAVQPVFGGNSATAGNVFFENRYYAGRHFIGGGDAVESLISARGGSQTETADPLTRAARRLSDALVAVQGQNSGGGASARLSEGRPVMVMGLTPEEVLRAVPEVDVDELHRAAEDVGIFASNYARPDELPSLRPPRPPAFLPPLPARTVQITAGKKVGKKIAQLEAAALPRAAAVEDYRGEVAGVFDSAANILERSVTEARE